MHGVGDAWAQRAFECFSLPPFLSVASQMEPDPEFPTVAFPNPEEQGALKEAMRLAEEKGGRVGDGWGMGWMGVELYRGSNNEWCVGSLNIQDTW